MKTGTKRRWAILGGLIVSFFAVSMAGACAPAPIDASCQTTAEDTPHEAPSTACAEPPATGCKRFFLPLLGNPSMNPELAAKYRAAFGLAACYVPADANAPFNCWYKEEDILGPKKDGLGKACTDAKRIGEVSGLAVYEQDKKYVCKKIPGTDDYEVQVGPDPAIKIDIKLGDAPLETSLIDVDGVPTEINGPYRNLPQLTTVKPGEDFYCKTGIPAPDGGTLSQKDWILQVNRAANDGGIRSDLAGFEYPCDDECGKRIKCTEPIFLKEPGAKHRDAARVHHEVRKTDLRGCSWGSNANGNAAVISRGLNGYLYNKYPLKEEVEQINKVPPYTYAP